MATVCKTVRPMLSDRCPVCPVLSVTLLYCGQTVGRIEVKHGMLVGLGPRHIVLHGNPAPPIRGTDPAIFSPCLLWPRSSISSQLLLSSLLYILQLSQCFTLYSFPSLSLLSKNQHSHIIPHCHLFLLITN